MSPNFFDVFKRKFLFNKGVHVKTSTTNQKNIDRTKYKKKINKKQNKKNKIKGRPISLHGGGNKCQLNEVNGCNKCKKSLRRKFSNIKTANVSANNSIVLTQSTELYKNTGQKSKCKCPCKRSKQTQANPKIEDTSKHNHKITGISLDGDCKIIDKGYKKRTKIDEDRKGSYEYDNYNIECTKKQQKGDFESPFKLSKKTKNSSRTERHSEISLESNIEDNNEKYSKGTERCTCVSDLIYKMKSTCRRPKECRLDTNIKGNYKIPDQDSCHLGGFHKEHVPNQFCDGKNINAPLEENKCKKAVSKKRFRRKKKSRDRLKKYSKNDFECPCTKHKKQLYTPKLEQLLHHTGQGFDCESCDRNLVPEKQNNHAKLEKYRRDLEKCLKELKRAQSISRNNRCCIKKSDNSIDQIPDSSIEPERYINTYNPRRKINKIQDGSIIIEKKFSYSFSNTDLYCDTESYQSDNHPDCKIEEYSEQMTKSQDYSNNVDKISNKSFLNTERRCNKSYQFDDQSASTNFEVELEQHIDTCTSTEKINKFQHCSMNTGKNTDRFYKKKSHHIPRQNPDRDIEDETEQCIKTYNPKDKINKAQDHNNYKENCQPSYPNPSSVSYYGAQTSSSDIENTDFTSTCYPPNLQPNCFSNSTSCGDITESCEDEENYLDSINKLIMKGPALLMQAIKCLCPRESLENLRSEDLVKNKVKWYEELKGKQEHELVSCFKNKHIHDNKDNRLKSKRFVSAGLKLKKVGQITPFMKGLKLSLRNMSKPFI